MIKCHLSRFMIANKMRVADVARKTGLHRNTVTLLYKGDANRLELDTIEKICRLFECQIEDLFELVND